MGAEGRRTLGLRGEEAVEHWYRDRGYAIVARNWRCEVGEIDLIVQAVPGMVALCEVKTRSSTAYGSPFDAVTAAKRRRLRRLAARWLASGAAGSGYVQIRFDVAAVWAGPSGTLVVEVIEEAF
ncbi:MAG TPA: YraN family protein [Acidimicrobiales bacterium]|nr:YraN family protein [Acidimicrobiales bacterium]